MVKKARGSHQYRSAQMLYSVHLLRFSRSIIDVQTWHKNMLYIVHVQINRTHAQSWHEWMTNTHIPELLETDCFDWAVMSRVEDEDTDKALGYRFTYKAKDADALDRYQRDFATALKADHTARYGEYVTASRDILPTEGYWENT